MGGGKLSSDACLLIKQTISNDDSGCCNHGSVGHWAGQTNHVSNQVPPNVLGSTPFSPKSWRVFRLFCSGGCCVCTTKSNAIDWLSPFPRERKQTNGRHVKIQATTVDQRMDPRVVQRRRNKVWFILRDKNLEDARGLRCMPCTTTTTSCSVRERERDLRCVTCTTTCSSVVKLAASSAVNHQRPTTRIKSHIAK